MESQEKINYSSQVCIINQDDIIYLENNAHLGRVSFWGGKKEASDIDYFDTALRELYEELGITLSLEEILYI